MTATPIPYTKSQSRALITTHIDDVLHGTSTEEATVLANVVTHLEVDNRNPHGLTVDDLDVYTREEVDDLVDAVTATIDGGTIP